MIRAILATAFILLCASAALSQKVDGPWDSWVGRVESLDVNAREITITPLKGDNSKLFTGVLEQGFKAQLLDDSLKELDVSEIPLGMRVRVFYKTREERVGGRKSKVNYIYGVRFIGRDEFDRLRVRLNAQPQAVVTKNEAGLLPQSRPLKLYLAIDPPRSNDELVKWVGTWNKEQGDKYGLIELIPDRAQSDVSLVVYNTQLEMADPFGPGPRESVMILPSAVVFLVAPKGDGLDVLWEYTPLVSVPSSPILMRSITKEIEKRMKARSKAQGK
jgi:hypothetical protein